MKKKFFSVFYGKLDHPVVGIKVRMKYQYVIEVCLSCLQGYKIDSLDKF